MTHQDQIIIICILAFISVPLGTFITIKTIKKLSSPSVNTLRRSGDIELGDIIESNRNVRTQDYPDLLVEPSQIYDRFSGVPPSYSTGYPPSYNYLDRYFINSFLENNINLNFIFWLIIISILVILILKILQWYLNKEERIVFTKGISSSEITYTRDYQELLISRIGNESNYDILYKKTYYHVLNYDWTVFDIIDWLNSLDEQDYATTFSLVTKTSDELFSNYPRIILSNEFMLNKNSNPVIISSLLSIELDNLYNMFDAEYNDNHYILIKYTALIASR